MNSSSPGSHVVADADVADVAAGPGGADGLHHRFLGADRLDDAVRAEATGELLDAFDALVAAFDDDVGGAEIPRQLLAGLVTAHRDDAFGAELLGGQHAAQAHRAVAHHGHRLTGADVGRNGAEPPGPEDVGRGQQVRDEIGGRNLGGGDQGAVGQRHPHPLGLGLRRGAEDLATTHDVW